MYFFTKLNTYNILYTSCQTFCTKMNACAVNFYSYLPFHLLGCHPSHSKGHTTWQSVVNLGINSVMLNIIMKHNLEDIIVHALLIISSHACMICKKSLRYECDTISMYVTVLQNIKHITSNGLHHSNRYPTYTWHDLKHWFYSFYYTRKGWWVHLKKEARIIYGGDTYSWMHAQARAHTHTHTHTHTYTHLCMHVHVHV